MSWCFRADRERLGTAATRPICGEARYSPARRRASGNILVVGESENKIKETRGDNLKEEIVERKVIKRKAIKEEVVI